MREHQYLAVVKKKRIRKFTEEEEEGLAAVAGEAVYKTRDLVRTVTLLVLHHHRSGLASFLEPNYSRRKWPTLS